MRTAAHRWRCAWIRTEEMTHLRMEKEKQVSERCEMQSDRATHASPPEIERVLEVVRMGKRKGVKAQGSRWEEQGKMKARRRFGDG